MVTINKAFLWLYKSSKCFFIVTIIAINMLILIVWVNLWSCQNIFCIMTSKIILKSEYNSTAGFSCHAKLTTNTYIISYSDITLGGINIAGNCMKTIVSNKRLIIWSKFPSHSHNKNYVSETLSLNSQKNSNVNTKGSRAQLKQTLISIMVTLLF